MLEFSCDFSLRTLENPMPDIAISTEKLTRRFGQLIEEAHHRERREE
jgi:hypothetical protein